MSSVRRMALSGSDDPLVSEELDLTRAVAASVQHHIAYGERAGQHVRRIGAGFGDALGAFLVAWRVSLER